VQREAAIWNIAFAIMTGILIGTAALTADADQTALAPPRVSELLFEVMVRVPVDRDHGFGRKVIIQSGGT
jgi:hypothetical protein